MKHNSLSTAKTARYDEFYTERETIEKELKYYDFSGKTVYCNCDDFQVSEFVDFFRDNFSRLKLNKVIATCFCPTEGVWDDGHGKKMVMTADNTYYEELQGNGSFDSPECVDLLAEADVVVTNPPFSLFIPFVTLLMKHGKDFIILGNLNAISSKEIFPYFQANKLFWGKSLRGNKCTFFVPDEYDGDYVFYENGKRKTEVNNVIWFTTFPIDRPTIINNLTEKFEAGKYPTYLNYPAINIDRIKLMPKDYFGAMGVPITFLDKYNPDEFEIIGCSGTFDLTRDLGVGNIPDEFLRRYKENGGKRYATPNIPLLCYYGDDGEPILPYARIIVKRRI